MVIAEQGLFTSPPIPSTWEEHLLTQPRSGAMTCLEFGVGDGRPACWLLDNLLVLEGDRYFGLDRPVCEQARRNLSRFREKAIVENLPERGFGALHLWWSKDWPLRDFDVVHIATPDARKMPTARWRKTCEEYTRVAWFVLRTGGTLIWDNVYPRRGVAMATVVEEFLEGLTGQWEVLFRKMQLAIRKTTGESSTFSPESALPNESSSH